MDYNSFCCFDTGINIMKKIFLTAAWKNLIMANYALDPSVLLPYLPAHTELDFFNGQCYVSLVGFMFEKVRLKGIPIPFHTHFPEVNLRFYVKHISPQGVVNRGVVFISEIVPKRAVAWVANTIYKEKYTAAAMKHTISLSPTGMDLRYSWRWKGKDNLVAASVRQELSPILPATAEAFIFEHYHGYAKVNATVTNMYTVEHPSWNTHAVTGYTINCAFEDFYGSDFSFLDHAIPESVFVAEGSAVKIREKEVLS